MTKEAKQTATKKTKKTLTATDVIRRCTGTGIPAAKKIELRIGENVAKQLVAAYESKDPKRNPRKMIQQALSKPAPAKKPASTESGAKE